MNFYSFFKSESKRTYKELLNTHSLEFQCNPAIKEFFCLDSLSRYRNYFLRTRLNISKLDISDFQIACYHTLPVDFPKSFYEDFYNYIFYFDDFSHYFHSTFEAVLASYRDSLFRELTKILEEKYHV